jgi:hypothetical protein
MLRLAAEMRGIDVATAALGPKASEKRRRDFANYLSRIERGAVKKVGLPKLAQVGQGLGFATLSSLFLALEKIMPGDLKSKARPLQDPPFRQPDTSEADRHADPVPVVAASSVVDLSRDSLFRLGEILDRARARADKEARARRHRSLSSRRRRKP